MSTLLDATFGPIGSPVAPMPVPWPRASNQFPTTNSTLHSVNNTFVDPVTGTCNLSDTATFLFNTTPVALSSLSLGVFSNAVAPPGAHNSVTFSNNNVGVAFNLSINGGTAIPCAGTGIVSLVISNTGSASSTLYYANPPAKTNYAINLTTLYSRCTSADGPFFVRVDTNSSNPSVGRETIQNTSGGYTVSCYADAHLQLSTDGVNWYGATNHHAMRLVPSGVAATVVTPTSPGLGSLDITAVGNLLAIFWPASVTNVVLQTTTNLTSPNWVTVSNSSPITGVTITNNRPGSFFRLWQP